MPIKNIDTERKNREAKLQAIDTELDAKYNKLKNDYTSLSDDLSEKIEKIEKMMKEVANLFLIDKPKDVVIKPYFKKLYAPGDTRKERRAKESAGETPTAVIMKELTNIKEASLSIGEVYTVLNGGKKEPKSAKDLLAIPKYVKIISLTRDLYIKKVEKWNKEFLAYFNTFKEDNFYSSSLSKDGQFSLLVNLSLMRFKLAASIAYLNICYSILVGSKNKPGIYNRILILGSNMYEAFEVSNSKKQADEAKQSLESFEEDLSNTRFLKILDIIHVQFGVDCKKLKEEEFESYLYKSEGVAQYARDLYDLDRQEAYKNTIKELTKKFERYKHLITRVKILTETYNGLKELGKDKTSIRNDMVLSIQYRTGVVPFPKPKGLFEPTNTDDILRSYLSTFGKGKNQYPNNNDIYPVKVSKVTLINIFQDFINDMNRNLSMEKTLKDLLPGNLSYKYANTSVGPFYNGKDYENKVLPEEDLIDLRR